MPDKMIIRTKVNGNNAVVSVLMAHEMDTGLAKDAAGKTIPAWFINEWMATLNGRTVMSAQWGQSVSKNPLTRFVLKDVKKGDKIAISWRDNKGETRTDETVVA
jgi:sulfur-oxidizing protein SoxZ